MSIIINPGSGPVQGATAEEATKNIEQFVKDLELTGITIERKPELDYDDKYHNGRFCFVLHREGRQSEIQMPGLPLTKVRWTGEPDQNIWDFPRLYENGSSWVWGFAVGQALTSLRP